MADCNISNDPDKNKQRQDLPECEEPLSLVIWLCDFRDHLLVQKKEEELIVFFFSVEFLLTTVIMLSSDQVT